MLRLSLALSARTHGRLRNAPTNLLAVQFFWNALKMLWLDPVSLILLIRIREQERR